MSLYELLGVSPSDELTITVLKKAYYAKALIVHPDKNPSSEACAKFQELSRAFQILSNPEDKARYDADGEVDDGEIHVDENMTADELMGIARAIFDRASRVDDQAIDDAIRDAKSNISEEDSQEIIRVYKQFDGHIAKIMQFVNCSKSSAIAHISKLIKEKTLKATPAFTKTIASKSKAKNVAATKSKNAANASRRKPKKTISK